MVALVPIKLSAGVAKILRLMADRESRTARRQFIVCVLESAHLRQIDPFAAATGAALVYDPPAPPRIPPSDILVSACRTPQLVNALVAAMARHESRSVRDQMAICVLESARRRGIDVERVIRGEMVTYTPTPPPEPCPGLEPDDPVAIEQDDGPVAPPSAAG